MPTYSDEQVVVLTEAYLSRRAHRGTLVLKSPDEASDPFDIAPIELKNLVRGIIWRDRHFAGESLRQIAREENLSDTYVRKVIMQSFDRLMAM